MGFCQWIQKWVQKWVFGCKSGSKCVKTHFCTHLKPISGYSRNPLLAQFKGGGNCFLKPALRQSRPSIRSDLIFQIRSYIHTSLQARSYRIGSSKIRSLEPQGAFLLLYVRYFRNPSGAPRPTESQTPQQQKEKFQKPRLSPKVNVRSPKVNVRFPKVNARSPKVTLSTFREFLKNLKFLKFPVGGVTVTAVPKIAKSW